MPGIFLLPLLTISLPPHNIPEKKHYFICEMNTEKRLAAYLLKLVATQHPQLLHVLFTELDEHSRQLSITEPSTNIPTPAP